MPIYLKPQHPFFQDGKYSGIFFALLSPVYVIKFLYMKNLFSFIDRAPKGLGILWTAALLLISALLFFNAAGREHKSAVIDRRTNSYMEGIRVINKDNGATSWVITADKAEFAEDETSARMDSVVIDMVDKGITLNADNGIYNINTKNLRLDDNIRVKTKDYTVYAKGISWNPGKEILTSDNKILVEGKKFKIEGEGINASEGHKIRLMKNVKASFF